MISVPARLQRRVILHRNHFYNIMEIKYSNEDRKKENMLIVYFINCLQASVLLPSIIGQGDIKTSD